MIFSDKKVLVTGGAGFIGSHLADRLLAEGAKVTVLDDLSFGLRENIPSQGSFIAADVRDYEAVRDAVKDQQVVFHMAACATTKESSMGWADPVYDMEVNTLGTLNVLRAVAEEKSGATVVLASSAAVYGDIRYMPIDEDHPTNPVSPYGVSKLASEKYCLAYHHECGVPSAILRIFNCYGPRQPRYVMHDFIMKLRDNPSELKIIGDGRQARDFCYIDDVVEGFLFATDHPGQVLNIATGVPTSIMSLAEIIKSIVAPDALISSEGGTWRGDIPVLLGDGSRLKKLGFAPQTSLDIGIRKLVASYEVAAHV